MTVSVQLRIINEHMDAHIVLINDFGKVSLVHNEDTRTENRRLYRTHNVNHGRRGTAVNDAEVAVQI